MIRKSLEKIRKLPDSVKASVAYTTCTILQRAISLITMPLFTRMLTTEQYGQYTIYQSWLSILTIAITLNLAYGSFSTAMIKFENDRNGYIASIQNLAIGLAGVFLVVYFPLQGFFNRIFQLPTHIILLMICDIVMQFALLCWYGAKRFAFQYKNVVLVTLLISIISPILTYFLIIILPEKGYARIYGLAVTNIIAGLLCFIYGAVKGKGGFSRKYWKYALAFNIPLLPYYISQIIFNESDRIMISHICGTDKASLYAVAYSLATLLVFVLNAINNSYVPWFYQKIKDGHPEDNKSVSSLISLLMAFMLLGVIALAPEIIAVLAAPEYKDSIWVVPPVAISILLLFYSQLFINVQFYFEEKYILVWASIGAAVLNVILNVVAIPKFGYVAAGYTTLASYLVFMISNHKAMVYTAKKRNLRINYFDYSTLILILAIFMILAFSAAALYNRPFIRYGIILAVFALIAIRYKAVISFIKSISRRK